MTAAQATQRPRLLQAMTDAFRQEDVRRKLMFTIAMLIVFRFVAHVPIPNVDRTALDAAFEDNSILNFLAIFSGGALQNLSVAALGVYPYITASIIMQILTPLVPSLRALQEVARAYLFAQHLEADVPVVAAVCEAHEACRARAARVAGRITATTAPRWSVSTVDDDAAVGGGSLARAVVPSAAVAVRCRDGEEAVRLARALRTRPVPVLTRVRGDEIRVNMTTIFPSQEDALVGALVEEMAARG